MVINVEKLLVLDYKWFNFEKKIMLVLVCSQKEKPVWLSYDASNDRSMKRYIWLKEVLLQVSPVRFGNLKKKGRKSKRIRDAYKIEILNYTTYQNTKWSKLPEPQEIKDIALMELYDMLNGKGVE